MRTDRPQKYVRQTPGTLGLVMAALDAKPHIPPRQPRTGLPPHIYRNIIDPLSTSRGTPVDGLRRLRFGSPELPFVVADDKSTVTACQM